MECFDGGSPKHNQLGGLLPFFKCAKNTVRYQVFAPVALVSIKAPLRLCRTGLFLQIYYQVPQLAGCLKQQGPFSIGIAIPDGKRAFVFFYRRFTACQST